MRIGKPLHEKYLFVCEHERVEGDFCGVAGAGIREALKAAVKGAGLDSRIRVSRSGCLDACASGPNVLLMPDAVWYEKVNREDCEAILKDLRARLGGSPNVV